MNNSCQVQVCASTGSSTHFSSFAGVEKWAASPLLAMCRIVVRGVETLRNRVGRTQAGERGALRGSEAALPVCGLR